MIKLIKKNIFIIYLICINLQINLIQRVKEINKSNNKFDSGPIKYISMFQSAQKDINYDITMTTNTKDNLINSFHIDPTLSYKTKYDIYKIMINFKPFKLFSYSYQNQKIPLNTEDTTGEKIFQVTHENFQASSLYQILRILQLNLKRKTSNVINNLHTQTDKTLRITQRDSLHRKVSLDLLNEEVKNVDTCINMHNSYSRNIFTIGANTTLLFKALNYVHWKNSFYLMPYFNLNIKDVLLTLTGFLNKNSALEWKEKKKPFQKKLFLCISFEKLRELKFETALSSKELIYFMNVSVIKNLSLGTKIKTNTENPKTLQFLQFNIKYTFTFNKIKFEIKFITPNIKNKYYTFNFWHEQFQGNDIFTMMSLKVQYQSKEPPAVPIINNLNI
jgi:hypothetical protein